MSLHDHPERRRDDTPSFWRSVAGLGLAVLLAVAGFYLLAEHRAHLFGVLPYLFLLACPLMHVFMHHGHHRNHASPGGPSARPDELRR